RRSGAVHAGAQEPARAGDGASQNPGATAAIAPADARAHVGQPLGAETQSGPRPQAGGQGGGQKTQVMPVLRFTRDKRGSEHFQLVQPGAHRRGTEKPRILYWFRSPPNVRVGCKPFDDAARAAVERHNPDLEFDWTQILATPIPSAEAERWRERRRQERAARQAAAEDEA